MKLVEMFGKTTFPPIDDRSYRLALGPHDFYWLSLQPTEETAIAEGLPPSRSVKLAEGWLEVFANKALVLIGEAIPPDELDASELRQRAEDAEQRLKEAEEDSAAYEQAERDKARAEAFLQVAEGS